MRYRKRLQRSTSIKWSRLVLFLTLGIVDTHAFVAALAGLQSVLILCFQFIDSFETRSGAYIQKAVKSSTDVL